MATLTTLEWIEILQDNQLTKDLDIAIFQSIYSFEGHKAPSSQIGAMLGYTGKNTSSPINSEIGRYGKRIANKYNVIHSVREDGKERQWDIFFIGNSQPPFFIWQLKQELIEALEATGLIGEEQFAEEIPIEVEEQLFEGAKRTIVVNVYERHSNAKQRCIDYYGVTCVVCSFNFENIYGKLGKDFIHVHHLTPISAIGIEYEINPVRDLRPVCPNCHSMLHKKNPPITIDELKALLTV